MTDIGRNFLDDAITSFRNYKGLAERAFAQVSDEEFFASIDSEANSIGVVAKHIAGNLRSRWRDFLTTDGEKLDRDRDSEFESDADSRQGIIALWEDGWKILFSTLESLEVDDLSASVNIRGQAHTVVEAINRQLTHYAYHIGQIVLLAKHFRGPEWKTLSVPKNRSKDFNQFVKDASGDSDLDRFGAADKFNADVRN